MCAILLDIYVRVGMTGIQEKLILSESKIRKDCWPPSPGGRGQCTAVASQVVDLVQLPTVHKCPYDYHHLQEKETRLEENKIKDQADAEKSLMKEVAEMKRRYQESVVKAVKRGEDVKKVKVPKKRIGIEKEAESEMTRKKQKLAFVFASDKELEERSKGALDKNSKEKASSSEKGRVDEKKKVGGEKGSEGGQKRLKSSQKNGEGSEKAETSNKKSNNNSLSWLIG